MSSEENLSQRILFILHQKWNFCFSLLIIRNNFINSEDSEFFYNFFFISGTLFSFTKDNLYEIFNYFESCLTSYGIWPNRNSILFLKISNLKLILYRTSAMLKNEYSYIKKGYTKIYIVLTLYKNWILQPRIIMITINVVIHITIDYLLLLFFP